jgi:hypothetical protein
VARLLDAVTPLADLLARTSEPDATVASIRAACPEGVAAVLRLIQEAGSTAGINARLMTLAAAQAGINATDDGPSTVAELAAIGGALEILVDTRREPDVSLVFTVPAFLSGAFDAFSSKTTVVRVERTAAVVSTVAATARSSLTIAAPFLAAVAFEQLVPQARRVLDSGGVVAVITRALSPRSPEPAQSNIAAVEALRQVASGRPGRLRVSSWEEAGLGVHLKTVVADNTDAYLVQPISNL